MAQQCGTEENPCVPYAWVLPLPILTPQQVGTTSSIYTGYIQNQSTMVYGNVTLTCASSTPQAGCTITSVPSILGLGETAAFGFTITGVGVTSSVAVTFTLVLTNGLSSTNSKSGSVQVLGDPLFTFTVPAGRNGSVLQNAILRATFDSLYDIQTPATRSWIDGVDVTSGTTTTLSGGVSRPTGSLSLVGGIHTWKLYLCFVGGRCDDATATFNYVVPPPPIDSSQAGLNKTPFPIEDIFPPSNSFSFDRTLAGALPLPPFSQRGCGVNSGDPDIWVDVPISVKNQVGDTIHPSGKVFRAQVVDQLPLTISTTAIDHPNTAGQQTCATLTYVPETQYLYQPGECDYSEPLWNTYPYGDRHYGGCYGASGVAAFRPSAGARSGDGGGAEEVRLPWLLARLAEVLRSAPPTGGAGGGTPELLPSAGAIDPSSYRILLNDSLVYPLAAGDPTPLAQQVTALQLAALFSQFQLPPGNPWVRLGAWNELVISVADSSGRRSSIRDRFYLNPDPGGRGTSVTRTLDRDLTRRSMGDCVAFGAVQCDETYLTQMVPGFTSRDKDRSLHLVYRSGSQMQRITLPVRLVYPANSARPDSLYTFARVNNVQTGPTLRFAGTKGAPGGNGAWPLAPYIAEDRMVGAELDPAAGALGTRQVDVVVREFTAGVSTDRVLSQSVIELHLTDTLATRFGSGWQLAEYTQLLSQTLNGQQIRVLVSGDGSYLTFTKVGSIWTAPADVAARLWEITGDPVPFRLTPPDGSVEAFYNDGRPAWHQDQLGNRTTFGYVGARLDSIADPNGARFKFIYADANALGRVSQILVIAPNGTTSRSVISLVYDATGRLTRSVLLRKLLPGNVLSGDTTQYSYTAAGAGNFLASITTPPPSTGASAPVTSFTYDTLEWSPYSVKRPVFGGVRDSMFYRSGWRLSVPQAYHGRKAGAPLYAPVRRDFYRVGSMDVMGRVTEAAQDRFGAPTLVRQRAPGGQVLLPDGTTGPAQGDIIRTITRDAFSRVTEIVGPMATNGTRERVRMHYNVWGQVDSLWRSSRAYPTPTGPDSLDLQTFTFDTASLGAVAGYAVGSDGWCTRLLTAKDPLGNIASSVQYMGSGRQRCLPWKVQGYGASNLTTFAYAGGVQAGVRPTSVTDPLNLSTTAAYDPVTWNTASTSTPSTGTTTMAYDPFGAPSQSTASDGRITLIGRDYSGRDSASRVGLGPVTRRFFGPDGQTDSVAIYAGAAGEGTLATVGLPQVTRSFYNALGLVDSTVAPGRRSGQSGSGIAGRVQRVHYTKDLSPDTTWTGNGAYTASVYDWLGRPIRTFQSAVAVNSSWGDASAQTAYQNAGVQAGKHLSAGQRVETWYDGIGRVRSVNSFNGYLGSVKQDSYGYSPSGAMVADTQLLSNYVKLTRTLQFDRLGRRLRDQDTLTAQSGGSVSGDIGGRQTYAYDPTTQLLTTVKGFVATDTVTPYGTVTWGYDVGGRETLRIIQLNNGTSGLRTVTGYTATGLVDSVRTTWGTGLVADPIWYRFKQNGYSAVGDLSGYAEQVNTGSTNNSQTYALTYSQNGLRQLLASDRSASGIYYHTAWAYDAFNNRITQTYTSNDAAVTGSPCYAQPDTSTFGADSRLTRTTNSLSLNQGCTTVHGYTYDYAGERVIQQDTLAGYSDPSKRSTMTYTAGGQLYFSITPKIFPDYSATWNWYDGSGLRAVSKEITVQQAYPLPDTTVVGPWTYYLYDGGQLALTASRTGNAWTIGKRQLSGGLDRPMVMRASSGTVALLTDRQGTFQTAITPAGAWDQTFAVTAENLFGAAEGGSRGTGGSTANTGFAGASTGNSGTGFVYLRNRWYDPQTGRFLTQDPIGLAGGVNMYAYAGNNPVSYSDPYGLCPTKDDVDDGKPCVVTLTVQRQSATTKSTSGTFTLTSNAEFSGTATGSTLELPAGGDGKGHERIAAGSYSARGNNGETPYSAIRLFGADRADPKNPDDILVHAGNEPGDTHGCILVGHSSGTDRLAGTSRATVDAIRSYIAGVALQDNGRAPTINVVVVGSPK